MTNAFNRLGEFSDRLAGPLALFVDLIAELVGLLPGGSLERLQISLERCHC